MWIIAILAGLAGLIIFGLSIPVGLELNLDLDGRPSFKMKLAWFFGLVRQEIKKSEKKPEDRERVAKGKRKSQRKGPGIRTALEILRVRGLLKQIKILLKSILRLPKIRDIEGDLRVGLGDPADTGQLFAFIGPIMPFLASTFLNKVKVQPSFAAEALLEGSVRGAMILRPIQLIPPLLRFVFSLPVLRVAKILMLSKWKRK
ncbi:MAG: DUF2953 domain-containing protein [Chloroflexota bacterium]